MRADAAGSDIVSGLAGPGKTRTVIVDPEYVGAICEFSREVTSGLNRRDACDGPAAQCLSSERVVFELRWELLGEVNDKPVGTDKLIRSVTCSRHVLVADRDATVRTGAGSSVGGEAFCEGVGRLELETLADLLGETDQKSVVPGSTR